MVSEGKNAGFHLPPMFPPEDNEGIQDPNMYREHYVFKVATYIPDPIGSILRSLPWIEMKNLDDNALFLGDNSSISILASNFPGCQRNSIYFSHDKDDVSLSKQGRNLQSGRITSFGRDGEIFAQNASKRTNFHRTSTQYILRNNRQTKRECSNTVI